MDQQGFTNRYYYKPGTDKLGGGSFGKVYKAYDTVLDKYVAIKVAEQVEGGGKTFSLLDEFMALANLPDHVNIAKYEQLFSYETPYGIFDYAIMQYYADGNLAQLIISTKLTNKQKESILLQILNGINFLHKHNVVHRDLKPSNILIHKRTLGSVSEYIPKITDFGLSKKTETNEGSRFTNSFGGGTLLYSSPEQLRAQELRFNTDLWAWAAIAFEVLTGKAIFKTESSSAGSAVSEKEILEQILNKDVSHELKELPANWATALDQCLIKDPAIRIKTATAVFEIMGGYAESPNLEPKPISGSFVPVKEQVVLPIQENNSTLSAIKKISTSKQKTNRTLLFAGLGMTAIAIIVILSWPKVQIENISTPELISEKDTIKNTSSTLTDTAVQNDTLAPTSIAKEKTKAQIKQNTKKFNDSKISWRMRYEQVGDFNEGLASVKKNGKYGFVNENGELVIPLIYYGCRNFSEGLVLVLTKNLKRGYINKNNQVIIQLIYDDGEDFKNGITRVNYNGDYFTINKRGQCVKDCP